MPRKVAYTLHNDILFVHFTPGGVVLSLCAEHKIWNPMLVTTSLLTTAAASQR